VKVVWYRAHGPEIVAVAGSGLRDLDQPIPHEVAGTSIEQVIDSIQAALQTHGSPELAEDVGRFAPPLKAALAGSPTIRAFIDNLRAADSHA
jgi:hypothetical protein